MCGIFAYINCSKDARQIRQKVRNRWKNKKSSRFLTSNYGELIAEAINKIQHRGPDSTHMESIDFEMMFGFHRLAIIDPSAKSDQPLFSDDGNIALVCNGEIFNYHELIDRHNLECTTKSDCEVILRMYEKFDIVQTVQSLDGEFAFVLYDKLANKIYAARDPFGVRPLFYSYNASTEECARFYFASEAKSILHLTLHARPFAPGNILSINTGILKPLNEKSNTSNYENTYSTYKYYDHEFSQITPMSQYINYDVIDVRKQINLLLTRAVHKRLMSDRPVGCLLSGGLDSSLVSAIAHRYNPNMHFFSIGLEDSVDVIAAKKVIKFLGVPLERHHIIEFTVEEGRDALSDVIYALESYDTTTIRASTPQYLLGKYISEKTNIKVLLSGEGADELFAGYQYSKMAPDANTLLYDSKRLMADLYLYDNLRTDRTLAAWGLEVRVPFLDKALVKYVMGIDPTLKTCNDRMEKMILRSSFNCVDKNKIAPDSHLDELGDPLLPHEILYRNKEAFSDAVSSKSKSWYRTLTDLITSQISDENLTEAKITYKHAPPMTKEALAYRRIFDKHFPNNDKLIPRYWMPQWQDPSVVDPSATVLKCHKGEL